MSKVPEQEVSNRFEARCGCAGGCSYLVLEKWDDPRDDEEWYGDFYQSVFSAVQRKPLRERLKVIWAALRGKEHFFAGIVLTRPDVERLRDFLVETTRRGSS